jgi:saccharopine dehydrogenase-like NADP-dependent oxidoreductase
MKTIVLFGAGKSATCLIEYLSAQAAGRDWSLVVADGDLSLAQSKIGPETGDRAKAVSLRVENEQSRETLIRNADIVISLLPPALHLLIARSCIKEKKDLLTASYLDDGIRALEPAIRENGLLFLCEMGLDPGIDHMSAMQLIHRIKQGEGKILSFRSHTGGLIAPESDDNPWHYKISWNPRNIVLAGSAGAQYKENDRLITRQYHELFELNEEVSIPGIGRLAWYPNRDSMAYIPVYGLGEAATFIRTTLRYPQFCKAWQTVVKAGLTNDQKPLSSPTNPSGERNGLLLREWSASIVPYIDEKNVAALEFLGLFDDAPVPADARTSADILQNLLETRLGMRPDDKDMIVMLHELEYETPEIIPGPSITVLGSHEAELRRHTVRSSLVVYGEDNRRTAMAKTVGLPLGIAAGLILEKKIPLSGLHIPVVPEIYEPVLQELTALGIHFEENFG